MMWSRPRERMLSVKSDSQADAEWMNASGRNRVSVPVWMKEIVSSVVPADFHKGADEFEPMDSSQQERGEEDVMVPGKDVEKVDAEGSTDADVEACNSDKTNEADARKETAEEAFQRGLQEGKSQLVEQVRKELEQDFEDRFFDASRHLGDLLGQIRRESRNLVVEIASAMAAKIVHREIQNDESWIDTNIQSCLDRRVPNGPMRLRVNPKIRDRLLALDPVPPWMDEMTSDGPAVKLVADTDLDKGDCILESERMRIDARLDVQVDSVRQVVESLVAGALFPESI